MPILIFAIVVLCIWWGCGSSSAPSGPEIPYSNPENPPAVYDNKLLPVGIYTGQAPSLPGATGNKVIEIKDPLPYVPPAGPPPIVGNPVPGGTPSTAPARPGKVVAGPTTTSVPHEW